MSVFRPPMIGHHTYNLSRVTMTPKAKFTHYAQLDNNLLTICGRQNPAGRALIVVDNLDPRETCDHCLRAKNEAEHGNSGDRTYSTLMNARQRRLDNGVR